MNGAATTNWTTHALKGPAIPPPLSRSFLLAATFKLNLQAALSVMGKSWPEKSGGEKRDVHFIETFKLTKVCGSDLNVLLCRNQEFWLCTMLSQLC